MDRARAWLHPYVLEARPQVAATVGVSAALVLLIGVGDRLTGPYLVFATFYLLPVAATAWFVGRGPALWLAGLAAVTGVVGTALDPGEVTPPVYVWNGVFRFVTYLVVAVALSAEREAMRTIQLLASTDPLTGLLNRRRFYEMVERELTLSQRSGRPVALAYVDIDDLKHRNDTYGHEAGDAILVEFAAAAQHTARSSDLLARLGGDEFGILLVDADRRSAEAVLDRLRSELAASPFLPITFSAGVVAGPADGEIDVEGLIRAADLLMIEAKATGKSCTVSRHGLTRTGAVAAPA